MMNNLRKFPIHPIIFAIYPVIALLGYNVQEIIPVVVVIPLAIMITVSTLIFMVLHLFIRNWFRAALLTTFLLFLFFTYGHVYFLLEKTGIAGVMIGRHRILLPIYLVILAAGIWWILKVVKNLPEITFIINIMTIFAVILPLIQIGAYLIQNARAPYISTDSKSTAKKLTVSETQPPDIYYLILDMYTRGDALQTDFNYNNTPFINHLKDLGFYVADCSRSNYAWTRLSLSSSLNMNYLQDIAPKTILDQNQTELNELIKHNLSRQLLEGVGYKTVAFETGFIWTEWYDADEYIHLSNNNLFFHQLEPFTTLLTRRTALKIVDDFLPDLIHGKKDAVFPYKNYVTIRRFVLDQLKNLPASQTSPKFVFAHITIPHEPFVFAPDGSLLDRNFWGNEGSAINDRYFQEGYIDQVLFINQQITEIVQSILQNSATPPIIILQGDHGARGDNRLENLNAYYLPGGKALNLYPKISPVNTFRVIFNSYFDTNYPLLEDKSFTLRMKQN
jgi:hypothetical protein